MNACSRELDIEPYFQARQEYIQMLRRAKGTPEREDIRICPSWEKTGAVPAVITASALQTLLFTEGWNALSIYQRKRFLEESRYGHKLFILQEGKTKHTIENCRYRQQLWQRTIGLSFVGLAVTH